MQKVGLVVGVRNTKLNNYSNKVMLDHHSRHAAVLKYLSVGDFLNFRLISVVCRMSNL